MPELPPHTIATRMIQPLIPYAVTCLPPCHQLMAVAGRTRLSPTCLFLSARCVIGSVPLDELRTLLDRHARPAMTTAIDGVLIGKATRAYESSTSMSGTVLALIAQGAKTLALGDRVYEYRAGQYLVASVDLPVTGHYTEAP